MNRIIVIWSWPLLFCLVMRIKVSQALEPICWDVTKPHSQGINSCYLPPKKKFWMPFTSFHWNILLWDTFIQISVLPGNSICLWITSEKGFSLLFCIAKKSDFVAGSPWLPRQDWLYFFLNYCLEIQRRSLLFAGVWKGMLSNTWGLIFMTLTLPLNKIDYIFNSIPRCIRVNHFVENENWSKSSP